MTSLLPKRSMLEDFDDSDPLADFSLSDDDFFDEPAKKLPIDAVSSKKSVGQTDFKKPEERSKKIVDLFGLDKSAELTDAAEAPKKDKADWLGLKDSPEPVKSVKVKNESPFGSTHPSLNTETGESADRNDSFTMSSALGSDSQRSRRRSEGLGIMKSVESKRSLFKSLDLPLETETMEAPKRVSFSDTTKKGDADYFGRLDDLDDLLPDRTTQQIQDVKNSDTQQNPFEKKVTDTEDRLQTAASKDYVPSAGTSGRRPSYGRRRDLETAPKTSASLLRSPFGFDDLETVHFDSLSGLTSREPTEKRLGLIPPTETQTKDTVSLGRNERLDSGTKFEGLSFQRDQSQLPPWLADRKSQPVEAHPETAETVIPSAGTAEDQPQPPPRTQKPEQPVINTAESTEPHITSAISLGEKTLVSEKTIQSLQQTHSQLLSVLKMQQQKEMMDSITARQLSILHRQEEQIDHLIQKHLEKQMKAEAIIEKQMQQINDIILVLMSQPDAEKPIILETSMEKEKNTEKDEKTNISEIELNLNRQILNLEDNIQHLEFENKKLRLHMEFIESKSQLELASMEKHLNYELDMKTKREEKLTKSLEQLEKEYEEKLSKLKQNEVELQNSFEEKIISLQNERMKDFQKLSELQKVVLEQTFAFNAQTQIKDLSKLVRPTIFEINKPENEEELSEREEKLLGKEKHLASMREALNRQKLALETQLESIANRSEAIEMEKLEQKVRFDNEMRQVKSEKNMLEMEKRAWRDEKDSDLKQIENLKHQVELMRESVFKQQEALVQEKLELASERAQVNAVTKMHGANLTNTLDLAQARAEVDGAMEAAKQAEKALDEEKQSLLEKKRQMMSESWKLSEREQEITIRENFVRQLLEESQRKKEEGLEALRRAKELENEVNDRTLDIQNKITELESQEQRLIKERLELAREWKELNRNKSQLEFLLPELTNEEKLLLQPTPRPRQEDRKLVVYKLPAEKEGDGFKPFPNPMARFNFNVA